MASQRSITLLPSKYEEYSHIALDHIIKKKLKESGNVLVHTTEPIDHIRPYPNPLVREPLNNLLKLHNHLCRITSEEIPDRWGNQTFAIAYRMSELLEELEGCRQEFKNKTHAMYDIGFFMTSSPPFWTLGEDAEVSYAEDAFQLLEGALISLKEEALSFSRCFGKRVSAVPPVLERGLEMPILALKTIDVMLNAFNSRFEDSPKGLKFSGLGLHGSIVVHGEEKMVLLLHKFMEKEGVPATLYTMS